jgi:hypothetical protein
MRQTVARKFWFGLSLALCGLALALAGCAGGGGRSVGGRTVVMPDAGAAEAKTDPYEIGRASCRERV